MPLVGKAQAMPVEIDRWDNWILFGNKIVFGGSENIKHSHELQWRLKDNMQALDQWFYEGVLTYSPNLHWEIIPDFRTAIKPDEIEFRPAFGVVRKDYFGSGENINGQLVQQVKYQLDIDNHGGVTSGLRYVLTYNRIISKKFVVSGLIGPFYRWGEDFTGVEFVRGGFSFAYLFDDMHTVGFAPLFGGSNLGNGKGWVYSFTPMFQVIFRVNKEYKYLPAKYINF